MTQKEIEHMMFGYVADIVMYTDGKSAEEQRKVRDFYVKQLTDMMVNGKPNLLFENLP